MSLRDKALGIAMVLTLIGTLMWTLSMMRDMAERASVRQLQNEKVQVCKDFIYESCTTIVGCGYARNREQCEMAIRVSSICEDPQSIDLAKYKQKIVDLRESTCDDIDLQPTTRSQKGETGLPL